VPNKRHITSAISQQFGRFASKEFSPWFQDIINASYVKLMGLDMGEFRASSSYPSLNALFTRTLRNPRSFSLDGDDFISPCDSLISECGDIDDVRALQIKGMSYNVNDLLGDKIDNEDKLRVRHGQFMNFYLSPSDYHRYHIPTNSKILKAVHIPGKFYPVNMPSLNKRVDLFIENERVVIECETTEKKRFYMVLVSALNVGKMQVSFEPLIQTNATADTPQLYTFDDLYLDKGDDFGCFEMGSTIVIIGEPNMFDLQIKMGDNVKFAQTIAKLL